MNGKINVNNIEIECNNKKEAIELYCKYYGKADKLLIYNDKGDLYTKKGGMK